MLAEFPGAHLVARVAAEQIFDNCPRYIHTVEIKEHSRYAPGRGVQVPIPEWKRNPLCQDALPVRDLEALAGEESATKPK